MSDNERRQYLIAQLDIVQKIIERMAKNSFLIKGWTISITAGVFAISSSNIFPIFQLLTMFLPLILILFWLLDSYYLYQERIFKNLYSNLVNEFNDEGLLKAKNNFFEINPFKISKNKKTSFWSSAFSKTEIPYLIVIVIIILFAFLLG